LFAFYKARKILSTKIIVHFHFCRAFPILALPNLLSREGIMAQDPSTYRSGSTTRGELPYPKQKELPPQIDELQAASLIPLFEFDAS
jgi:hypothetical protein